MKSISIFTILTGLAGTAMATQLGFTLYDGENGEGTQIGREVYEPGTSWNLNFLSPKCIRGEGEHDSALIKSTKITYVDGGLTNLLAGEDYPGRNVWQYWLYTYSDTDCNEEVGSQTWNENQHEGELNFDVPGTSVKIYQRWYESESESETAA